MLPKLIVVRVFNLMEVVFVKLPNKTGKVGVFEHSGQYRLREIVHVL